MLLTPSEAWQKPGFRIQLRVGGEELTHLNAAPDGGGLSITAEPGIRLSRWWSLAATLHYTILSGQMMGLRWSTLADVTFHPVGGLFITGGVGYAGMLARSTDTGLFDSARCAGSGIATSAGIGYLIPVGQLFATGPVVKADLQWTSCGDDDSSDTGGNEDDLSFDPPPHQTWRHLALYLAWSLAWR